MNRLLSLLRGDGLRARALRSSGLTIVGYGSQQVIRLASNLILTRLLFPEAFGMMVLVSIFMMGLAMFSDLGVGPSIMQNKRGDEPDFLNTAWTIQVIRGVVLWVMATALAWPMAAFYEVPELTTILPVASLTLLIMGFYPTRLESASRHLMLGRVTVIEISTQVISIIVAVILALIYQSVWALVISGLVATTCHLIGLWMFLPGEANRFRWEREAVWELIRFGKWIFLSTVAGFLLTQGDKIVLGKFLSLEMLGIYNIGFFLASFPMLLGAMVVRKTLIPLYRDRPPAESAENFAKLHRMRMLLSGGLLGLLAIFVLGGAVITELLYDPRYHAAGGMVVLLAAVQIPLLVALTYDQAALASGTSHRFFVLAATRAGLMILGLLVGLQLAGLFGALIGQGVAMTLAYPVVVWLARREGAWDPRHDMTIAALGAVLAGLGIWLNFGAVAALMALS